MRTLDARLLLKRFNYMRIQTRLPFAPFSAAAVAAAFFACSTGTDEPLPDGDGAGSGGAGSGGAAPSGASVVEDVEDGDTSILEVEGRSGNWYGYSVVGTVTFDPTAVGHAGNAMGVAFDAVDSGWSGFGFNLKGTGGKELYDAALYDGVSFWIRGDAATSLTFAVADVTTDPDGDICTECHDHWATSVAVTTEWTQIKLHWSDLSRGGWGVPATEAMVITQLLGLAWNIEAPGTITVFVDDVELFADGVVSSNVTTVLDIVTSMGGGSGEEGGLPWVDGEPATGPSPVERYGQLRVDGGKLLSEDGDVAMLRGQAIGWDNWWPQYHNADVVAWLRSDWCADVVRPAMGIEPEGAYLENPDVSKGRMTTVIDAAIENGMYVIIDWHAHDIHQSEAIAFFSEMAEAYGDSPNVIYEVFNEPETEETWPDVKAYAEAVIAAIRVHDPDNIVIVGTPEWDQRIDLVIPDPITSDPNILYALHFYAGTHGEWLRTRAQTALDAGIPIIVSESGGSEADGSGGNDYDEWAKWFTFMEDRQISWVNWSISDKAGETVSLLEPGAPASGAWTEDDLTPTGVHIRSLLRGYGCP